MTHSRPQRIFAPSPPGALLKREITVLRPKGPARERDANHLAQIRECPCLYCGLDPCGEAAHVRFASASFGKASGMGKKPSDRHAVPLCGSCHRTTRHAQHNQGEKQFWDALGINPLLTADLLYAQRGDLVAMRAVIFVAISQRGKK